MAAGVWRDVHPANVRPGDVTPAGPVESVDVFGSLRFAVVTIGGTPYRRPYAPDGWVSVQSA
jgi:hypothetical protein